MPSTPGATTAPSVAGPTSRSTGPSTATGAAAPSFLRRPIPRAPRDEIAYYVVGALAGRGRGRGRWSDEEHGALVELLEELIEIDREPVLEPVIEEPLIGELLEKVTQTGRAPRRRRADRVR